MTQEVGIAVLGCGYWGVNYLRVFTELPGARVVVACDLREARLKEIAPRFPGIALTTSIDEVLEMPGVDAVVVCTEPSSHFDVTRRCLAAGKHVLIEKPMTTLEADGAALIELAARQAVTLMVGHTFIYNSGVRKVKEYISEKKIGQIYYLYARRTNLGPIRHDVNAIWDLATHDISIFNYLLGETPLWVSAVGINLLNTPREDVGFISLGYSNDVVGHIHVSWAEPNKVREVVVVGNNMRIVFDDINPIERVRVYEKGVTQTNGEAVGFGESNLDIRDGDIISPKVQVSEPLKNQCAHFLDCVNQGLHPLTDGYEGLAVVQVLNAIDRSLQQNGTPIDITPVRN